MGVRVLIAGEQEKAMQLKESLKRLWLEVESVVAGDGFQAEEVLQDGALFQVAFLDISLKPNGGLPVFEHIQKLCPDCQVIFLIEYPDLEFLARYVKLQQADYLLKPLSQIGIETVVQKVRKRYQNGTEHRRKVSEDSRLTEQPELKKHRITDEQWKNCVSEYMAAHLHEPLTLELAGAEFGTSGTYFCKRFKRVFQKNFVTYLTEMRINAAKELLVQTSLEVCEIAFRTGFGDAAYFTKIFGKKIGCTPTAYRCKWQKNTI